MLYTRNITFESLRATMVANVVIDYLEFGLTEIPEQLLVLNIVLVAMYSTPTNNFPVQLINGQVLKFNPSIKICEKLRR